MQGVPDSRAGLMPTGGEAQAPLDGGDPELGLSRIREEGSRYLEQLVDDKIELEQDAHRLARHVLGSTAPKPLPPAAPLGTDRASQIQGLGASLTRSVVPKHLIHGGNASLADAGHQGRPKTQRRQRVLIGDAPEQQVLHRPSGLPRSGAVVAS